MSKSMQPVANKSMQLNAYFITLFKDIFCLFLVCILTLAPSPTAISKLLKVSLSHEVSVFVCISFKAGDTTDSITQIENLTNQ